MSTEFAIADVSPGKLNALVKNLMRQTGESDPNEAVRLLNSGEWVVSKPTHSWHEKDGVIYFNVTSDGTTGEDWITRLESKGFSVDSCAKQVLRSADFKPTNGVTTEVAVLKGCLFEERGRTTSVIRAEADKRKLSKPNTEITCLIREKFTDKKIEAMGLWYIVAMHEPINDSGGDPVLLYANRSVDGRRLKACHERPLNGWHRDSGFAFAVSHGSAQP
ncbi:MAG: hypothetical protein AAB421_00600 [Patescibacteria group bacterium]